MNQYETTPEFILEQSEKILPTERVPVNLDRDYMAVVADLDLLYKELTISVDILGKIRDSVRVLELSLEAQS